MEKLKTHKELFNINNFPSSSQNLQINKLRSSIKAPISKEKLAMIESINNLKEKLNKKTYDKIKGNLYNNNVIIQRNTNLNAFIKLNETNQNTILENVYKKENIISNDECLSKEKNHSISNNKNINNNSASTKITNGINFTPNNNFNNNIYQTNFNSGLSNINNFVNSNNINTANYFNYLTTKKFSIPNLKNASKDNRIPKQDKNIRNKLITNTVVNKLSFRLNEKNDFIIDKNLNKYRNNSKKQRVLSGGKNESKNKNNKGN
jgi:hypothetical protein